MRGLIGLKLYPADTVTCECVVRVESGEEMQMSLVQLVHVVAQGGVHPDVVPGVHDENDGLRFTVNALAFVDASHEVDHRIKLSATAAPLVPHPPARNAQCSEATSAPTRAALRIELS